MINVKFAKLHPDATIPVFAKSGDAGMDLTVVSVEKINDPVKGDFYEYKFGLACEIPYGYVGFLFPRSSISRTDLSLSNAVGVLDSGYRGEIGARFKRTSQSPRIFGVGERAIQMVVLKLPEVNVMEVSFAELSKSERGTGGFGSSGKQDWLAKTRERSELEVLRADNKRLKKENTELKRRASRLEKRSQRVEDVEEFFEEMAFEEAAINKTQFKDKNSCPECLEGMLVTSDLGVRTMVTCNKCKYRKSSKK